ncbi:long-chain-acyl-CoA synthetase [Bradyrhizobium sp. SSUT77]|uniref:long-chain-acyl-CoA synthetase n=1 Tax=Bradyrhizobium sp. SSUT77 TaxID=3040603 RepID=UPI00244BD5B3|nr:long-chain-acyl-CoA synthetase [Bradyrhizobium sp. SSUT77]MDH2347368.1 long-chain-acyl-CoA synthetase [Bradyrhizobium sp. SSUT77]
MKPVEQRFCFNGQASRINSDCKVAATSPTGEQVRADADRVQPRDHIVKTAEIQRGTGRGAPQRRRSAAKTWLQAIALTARLETQPHRLFADIVEEWAQRQPDRPALLSDGQSFTYGELTARINRYARWARGLGLHAGRTVCLLMPNRPDYLACWLGISSVGGTVALINTRLVGRSLAHCIDVAHADHLILASDCVDAFESARPHLERVPQSWTLGTGDPSGDLDAALAAFEPRPLSSTERGDVTIDGRALLVYTSGTTGLAKAANISHRRILSWGGWFAGLTDATTNDRLYDCLPLHHSVGGIAAPCSMLCAGASVVIAEKFSAGSFWDDIERFDCTVFQYIGELCRYLLKAPASERKARHGLRLAVGNGLRGDIWEVFASRFAIPQILEFYAATEGNFSLFNVEGKPGAIGRIPPVLAHRFPASIVKVDVDSGNPLRSDAGLCVACATGETGEAVGRIGGAGRGGAPFEGYTDPAETAKKILRNVFAEGDAWFRTGDLMLRDEQGYLHFIDRVGDTFRWKGENVATSEVNDAIRDCPGVLDASTYGVAVSGADGRAGMAALVVDQRFDFGIFREQLSYRLPRYAVPAFVRLCRSLDATDTFKQKKQRLIREGFDPSVVGDPLFLRDPVTGDYRSIDRAVYARIVAGEIRL